MSERIKLVEAGIAQPNGWIFNVRTVEELAEILDQQLKRGPISVVSSHDGTIGIDTDKIVGHITKIEHVNFKIIGEFEELKSNGTVLRPKYVWKIAGWNWWGDTVEEVKTAIGYQGPKIYRVRDGFKWSAIVREEIKTSFQFNSFWHG